MFRFQSIPVLFCIAFVVHKSSNFIQKLVFFTEEESQRGHRLRKTSSRRQEQRNSLETCSLSDSRSLVAMEDLLLYVCNHFLLKYAHKQFLSGKEEKICRQCTADNSGLRKVFWDNTRSKWEAVRPRTRDVYGTYKLCKDFMRRRPCMKTPCRFAHGDIERWAWTEERKEGRNIIFRFTMQGTCTNHFYSQKNIS